jgi:hypothetical protein
VCASAADVAAKCNEPHKGGECKAFTYDGACGYLKYANSPLVDKEGWTAYVKA